MDVGCWRDLYSILWASGLMRLNGRVGRRREEEKLAQRGEKPRLELVGVMIMINVGLDNLG